MNRQEAIRHVRTRLRAFALDREPVAALVIITDERESDWDRLGAAVTLALQGRREAIPLFILALTRPGFAASASCLETLVAAFGLGLLDGPGAASRLTSVRRPMINAMPGDEAALDALLLEPG